MSEIILMNILIFFSAPRRFNPNKYLNFFIELYMCKSFDFFMHLCKDFDTCNEIYCKVYHKDHFMQLNVFSHIGPFHKCTFLLYSFNSSVCRHQISCIHSITMRLLILQMNPDEIFKWNLSIKIVFDTLGWCTYDCDVYLSLDIINICSKYSDFPVMRCNIHPISSLSI